MRTVIAYPVYPFSANRSAASTQAETTAIQDARGTFTHVMFQQMPDGHVAGEQSEAERVLARLAEASADLRSVALLGPTGEVLAATTSNDWSGQAQELWDAAAAVGADPQQVHIATEGGEVFAVRSPNGTAAIAVAQRFTLASLMFCDLRAALRDLERVESAGAEGGESAGAEGG